MKDRISPLLLGLQLIRLHVLGWRSLPGYSVTRREPGGSIYVAMWLDR